MNEGTARSIPFASLLCQLEAAHTSLGVRVANRRSKNYPIVVLSGGWGEPWENDHTQGYARMVVEVLGVAGYDAIVVDCGNKRDLCSQMSQITDEIIAYNCIFGRYGEDGTIAALLEFLEISYTGSGPLASALSMDKARCAALLSQHEVRVPRMIVLEAKYWSTLDETDVARLLEKRGLCFSKSERVSKEVLIVKPNQSSFGSGVTALSNFDGFREALRHAGTYSDSAVIQEFVEGMT